MQLTPLDVDYQRKERVKTQAQFDDLKKSRVIPQEKPPANFSFKPVAFDLPHLPHLILSTSKDSPLGFERFIGRNPFDLSTNPSTFSTLSSSSFLYLMVVASLWTSINLLLRTISDDAVISTFQRNIATVVFQSNAGDGALQTNVTSDKVAIVVLQTNVSDNAVRIDVVDDVVTIGPQRNFVVATFLINVVTTVLQADVVTGNCATSSDLFDHPFAETPHHHHSLIFFDRRASPAKKILSVFIVGTGPPWHSKG